MVNEEKEALNNDALTSFAKDPIKTCLNMFDNFFNKHKKEEVKADEVVTEEAVLEVTPETTEEVKADEVVTEEVVIDVTPLDLDGNVDRMVGVNDTAVDVA